MMMVCVFVDNIWWTQWTQRTRQRAINFFAQCQKIDGMFRVDDSARPDYANHLMVKKSRLFCIKPKIQCVFHVVLFGFCTFYGVAMRTRFHVILTQLCAFFSNDSHILYWIFDMIYWICSFYLYCAVMLKFIYLNRCRETHIFSVQCVIEFRLIFYRSNYYTEFSEVACLIGWRRECAEKKYWQIHKSNLISHGVFREKQIFSEEPTTIWSIW